MVIQKTFLQYKQPIEYYQHTRSKLEANGVFIHIDFGENYVGKMSNAIQQMHFGASETHVSLHTGFYQTKDNGIVTFCGVSDSLVHNPSSIWAYMIPILAKIRDTYPHIEHVVFFSDGPTTQYRQ